MDFFERQRTVRGSSARLVVLFVLAVVAIVAVLDLLAYAAVLYLNDSGGDTYDAGPEYASSSGPAINEWAVVGVVSVVVVLIIGLTSWIQTALLKRGGGTHVAESIGAVPIEDLPDSPLLRRYRNVVEEVSIASSTPVPRLYVMTEEKAINAFAAGSTPADAAVAVTQGCLARLNRDELQGVIAHEFSHIVNGDMRLSMRLMGVLAGITGLAVAGRMVLHMSFGRSNNNSRDNNAAALMIVAFLIGIAAMAVGFIGLFFARMIKAAVSRQREYLADASAVQYTRQTAGLAGALKKIGGLPAGSKLRNDRTENVSHMLFGEGMSFSQAFATHPPLEKRIGVLDPSFAPEQLTELQHRWKKTPPDGLGEDRAMGLAQAPSMAEAHQQRSAQGAPRVAVPLDPDALSGSVGTPSEGAYEVASQLLNRLPAPLVEAAHRPEGAVPLLFALVLDPDARLRGQQLGLVEQAYGRDVAAETDRLGAQVSRTDRDLRLPLAEVAFPTVRYRPDEEIEKVGRTLSQLAVVDQRISVLEWCLGTLTRIGLHEARTHRPPWPTKRSKLWRVQTSVTTLISVLAWAGATDHAAAERAFHAGIGAIDSGSTPPYTPPARGLDDLTDAVWGDLDGLSGGDLKTLVRAIAATVGADQQITVDELELVRTVCGILHCPVPPQVAQRLA